ncbi:hypothetical protein A2U01_0036658 [Trifolium medium]|uniref:Uncharacterized protein n=1 Tax=Trifolium medium TaxID=97028 RepID=A0A392PVN9_9FABA|nr:hypothetical protein [Trifolium medium]
MPAIWASVSIGPNRLDWALAESKTGAAYVAIQMCWSGDLRKRSG